MRNSVNLKALAQNNPAIFADDPNTLALVNSGKARFRNRTYFHRKVVSLAAGIQELLDKTADTVAGVTDLVKGGYVEENTAFLLTGIRLRYAYHASDSVVSDKLYSNNIFNPTDVAADSTDQDAGVTGTQSAPVPVRLVPQNLTDGSYFKLSVGAKEIYKCLTGDFFKENIYSDFNRGHEIFVEDLGNYPQLILPKKQIVPTIEMATGLTSPSGVHFIEFSLIGGEIYE